MKIENNKKEYESDKHCIYSCQYHVVFCTKYRRDVLTKEVQNRLKELVINNQDKFKYKIYEIDILADYVHMIVEVSPVIGVHYVVSKIKGLTSSTLRKEFPSVKSRLPTLWTRNKFISTVGTINTESISQYIESQRNT